MSSGALSPWAFFKNTFYKFCFGLGLATLSYYSFAGVKTWIDERNARVTKGSQGGLQEKIDALAEGGSGSRSAVQMTQFPLTMPEAAPLPSGAPLARAPEGDVSVLPANPEGSPAPVGTPDPAAAAGLESAPNPAEGEVAPNGGMEMPAPFAIPYVYDPASYDSGGETDSGAKRSEGSSSGGGASNGISAGPESFQAAAVPGLFGSSGQTNTNASQANLPRLLPQDLPFLTTGLKGVFTSQPVGVNSSGSQATVHTSRWTPSEGLSPEVKFAIVGSNVNALTFQVGVNLQGVNGNYTLHTGVGSVITANARNEYRSGQLYRVFDFQISNISVRAGEILRQVRVTLSFEAGSSGNPVVGADSSISFVRTQASMVQAPWNFNAPAANTDPVVVADQVNYSMPIERMP